jgi:hypothetical protein
MAESNFKSLNGRQAWKSVAMAFGAAVLTSVYGAFNDGVDWPTKAEFIDALRVGITASLNYVIITFFTNSDGEAFKKEQ